MFVDLHIHSYFSDGAQTPEEAARICRDRGVGLAALCDHNNWLGCERFADACRELGVIPLRGVELDCRREGKHLHILGYNFTPTPELAALAHRSRELLLQMSVDLVDKMVPEYPVLSTEEYRNYRYDAAKGGWAGLHYLTEKGVTASPEMGMPLYKKYGLDYSTYPFPDAAEVIAAIRKAGGVPILAHPCNYFAGYDWRQLYLAYDALCKLGLQGFESYYPGQSNELTLRTAVYCERHSLYSTSGSDSHGCFAHADGAVEYSIGSLMAEPHQLRLEGLVAPELLR